MADQFRSALHLPKTDFPMKARLSEREPEIIKLWRRRDIPKKIREKRKSAPVFFLPDGPPYANGDIHIGHALNKILKDIALKYKSMAGFQAPFLPSWDCHGLPIELKALERAAENPAGPAASSTAPPAPRAVRELCRREARRWIERQKKSFQRLGVLAHWEKPLLTMDPAYEAEEVRQLARLAEKGLLYRGKKPVFWCFKLQTALAFSEAVYRDRKSPSIYVKFSLGREACRRLNVKGPAAAVIWTTTPWTLPANSAIALHPDFKYSLCRAPGGELWLVAEGLREAFSEAAGLSQPLRPQKTFKGRELEGLSARHPFIERDSPLVLGAHVSLDAGTGCVHTAPGHGLEDFGAGKKYRLPARCPVDERGHFTEEAGEDLKGAFIFKGNKIIQKRLRESGHLIAEGEITHSYPHSERSGSPLIYRLTPQWFLALDREEKAAASASSGGKSLRRQALAACDQVQFNPPESRARLEAMLRGSPDWCLSRQRLWGVPIPVFYCRGCGEPLLSPSAMRAIADGMEAGGEGIEYYFSRPAGELLPAGAKCAACGGAEFKKGGDILDVWFDSGIQRAVFEKLRGMPFPADLFLEGSDQHRGWFQTSLISAIALEGGAPFKALVTHGLCKRQRGAENEQKPGQCFRPSGDDSEKRGGDLANLDRKRKHRS